MPLVSKMRQTAARTLAVGYVMHQQSLISAFLPHNLITRSLFFASADDSRSQPRRTFMTTKREASSTSSFQSWTFDKPCARMEWNELSKAELKVGSYSLEVVNESDLILVGIMAPPKEEDDDEDKEVQAMPLSGIAKDLDGALGGALTDLLAEHAKTFRNGATLGGCTPVVRVASNGTAKRYALLGLGAAASNNSSNATDDKVDAVVVSKSNLPAGAGLKIGKTLASKCSTEKKVKRCSLVLPHALASNATIVTDISTGLYQNLYCDNRYRTGARIVKPAEDLAVVTLLSDDDNGMTSDAAATAVEQGKYLAAGVMLTKDIVNAPHNVLNSESLAETAQRIADQSKGRIQCLILGKKECEQRRMGAYLGVARGSETEPRFIHLTYRPPSSKGGPIHKKVGCIGKGLLFDTGGYNIKTQMMEKMKFDCGGSAAVLGAAHAIGMLQPEGVEAHFIVAACENMINDRAVVPSDILTASNGKTIEVMNTDAEGRLTLADAFVYADKEVGCDEMIELSTLTGACMVALGKEICGFWTFNDDLGKELEDISKATGDTAWRMPLHKSYNEGLKGEFADLKNIGGKYGGAITAALFLLCNFVDPKKPAAHIDIAGPVWSDKTYATGFGTKMVVEWVRQSGLKKE